MLPNFYMNSVLDIFFSAGAIQAIFKLGFIPEDDEFFELTSEQYQAYYALEDGKESSSNEKVYMLLPKDPQKYQEFAVDDTFILTERDVSFLEKAERIIESYCEKSGEKYDNFDEKLRYCASVMPDVFSEGSKYSECRLTKLQQ